MEFFMAHILVSKKKAQYLSLALFVVGLAILTYTQQWWPSIMLVIGLPLALRQFLLGRRYDVYISLFVFIGAFISVQFDIAWKILLPVLFTLSGIYIFFRDFFISPDIPEAEEKNKEIEEEEKKKDQ